MAFLRFLCIRRNEEYVWLQKNRKINLFCEVDF